jgi:hypothetical protein
MSEYRAYFVGDDGHFTNVIELECADDTEAKERAKQFVTGHDIEVWQLGRKVTMLKAAPFGGL